MLLTKTRSRRMAAATLFVILLNNLLFPVFSYALTSGPTAPEATSFEPIDTTDMVNLQTGDFTYNMPLLEVPGPEGGYPLSLSYHAGIQPNEDASWVGLGWTLNPGAISRNVNGYPDDWNAIQSNSHEYWEGGSTRSYNVGVNIGIGNTPATVGVDLSFSQDTYRGFGVGMSISGGKSWSVGAASVNANIGVGVNAYSGDGYVFGGIGIGGADKGVRTSLGIGFSTNFESLNVGVSGGVGYSSSGLGGSLLKTSLSTGGGKPSVGVGGLSASVSASQMGNVQTDASSFSVDIPVYYFNVSLGYSKTRYWIDKSTNITLYGSMTEGAAGGAQTINGNNLDRMIYDDRGYDTYSLLEDPSEKSIVENSDPTRVQGGAYPDFDNYRVTGQGLGGDIRPYKFQGRVFGQNRKKADGTRSVNYYSPGVVSFPAQFRFEGDFSNSYRQAPDPYLNYNSDLRLTAPPFATPVFGNEDGSYGYAQQNRLAGSKYVEIGPTVKVSNAYGYDRNERLKPGMIEGFSITNESGVTYHYGLPAYSWGEENYQEKIDQTNGINLNRGTKGNAYAYTWYLTSITGPDYVERDASGSAGYGIASEADWGYWVNFEYGKWSNNYVWRNPSEGYHRDEDNQFQNCSMGKKEVYYLNAIRTRSHVAFFEKEVRQDGKGASPEVFNKNVTSKNYTNAGLFNINSSQSLRLNKIYLLNASDGSLITPASGNSNAYKPIGTRTQPCSDCELAANVLDKTDVDAVNRATLESKAIRIIDFSYDYTLCPVTTNSYDINTPSVKSGKLSLKSVVFRGKGGVSLIPPTKFEYDLDAAEQRTINGRALNGLTGTGSAEVGDMLVSNDTNQDYIGVVVKKIVVDIGLGTYAYTLSGGNVAINAGTVYRTTKNPPYNKDAYDNWGMYKSDISAAIIAANENMGRSTSIASSKGVDAWCLRKINTPIGSSVKAYYESDQFSSVVLNNEFPFTVNTISTEGSPVYNNNVSYNKLIWSPSLTVRYDNPGYNNIKFTLNLVGQRLSDFFTVGSKGKIVLGNRYFEDQVRVPSLGAFQCEYTINTIDTDGTIHASISYPIPSILHVFSQDPNFPDYIEYDVNLVGIVAANVSPTNVSSVFAGGGIRIGKISITDNSSSEATTAYNYNLPGNLLSSGTTSYTPSILDISSYVLNPNSSENKKDYDAYRKVLYANLNALYSISREIPPPGVMYQYVTITSNVKNSSETVTRPVAGSTQYQFEVFRENMVYRNMKETPYTHATPSQGTMDTRNISVKKFMGNIGSTKRITQYDKDGKKLSETINYSLHDGLENNSPSDFFTNYKNRLLLYNYLGYEYKLKYQGLLQERYSEVKVIDERGWTTASQVKATMSAREDYPNVPLGQTVINYVNGTQTTSQNLAFDFYSGALTKSVETDAYGDKIMTETTPAYLKYPSMGLKIASSSNKNMLTQTAASYTYKVDGANDPTGIISASINTWSNLVPAIDANSTQYIQNNGTNGYVWRPQYTYNWMPVNKTTDNLTPKASFVDYNWATPTSLDPNWKKTSEATLYDVYSKALEAIDINGNYAATRMNALSKKVELSGVPAKYYEIAYSGAEDANVDQPANGFVKKADGTVVNTTGVAHTGSKSLKLDVGGKKGFVYTIDCNKLTPGRDYMASVWVKPVTGTASDVKLYYDKGTPTALATSVSSNVSTKAAGSWKLINIKIDRSAITANTTINIGCRNDHASVQAYIDDFRFQPLNAGTTAYVYDAFSGELTYILDNNNLYTKFEYDAAGRLVKTYREKLGVGEYKTNEYQINFGKLASYSSPAISEYFVKNNCAVGQMGTAQLVTLPAGAYTSVISSEDANTKARDYAQTQANSSGTCGTTASLLLRKMVSSGTSYSATVSASDYAFPSSGGTTFSIPSGVHNISVQVSSGTSVNNTFVLSVPGSPDRTITGSSASWSNIIVPYQSTATILILY